jgi:hypothetical protein
LWKRKIYSTRGPLNLCPSSIFPKEKKIKGPSCKAPMAPHFGYPLNSGDKKKKCGPIIKLAWYSFMVTRFLIHLSPPFRQLHNKIDFFFTLQIGV